MISGRGRERRPTLTKLVAEILGNELRFSEAIAADPDATLASACALGLEGIMGKQVDAPYRSGRSDRWIKLKCSKRQEFVIGGFSRRKGATAGVRALLLDVYEEGSRLRYVGHIAPRFTPRQAREFESQLAVVGCTGHRSSVPLHPKARVPLAEFGSGRLSGVS
jgi:bifunctional non-homologous end joining protein LigD